ncbi:MAG: MFS general substrate transporter [Lasallia pustulata]|uniref:MFS general substrate transporter n=1 Tax=Lasallia pustulata TaxID=136370 RepID=A0A5M8PQ23_9LECA|nr:MAG: MFS general substrate transporter [Lasallia pustulata]
MEKQIESPPDVSPSTAESGVADIDYAAEKRLVRKLDIYIIPLVMLLYLLSFLDRVNIGNARLYGMEEDLGLKGNEYQIAVSLLFVTYTTSELPSNLVLKKFQPSKWISIITTLWGIIATLTGVTHTYGELIACRILLGLVEGGLFPGMVVYLTFFYTKRELALRIGYLFVSAALAGACGGLLAYGIGHMDNVAGLRAWRWIMIIEGLPTFCLGIATWFLLADTPQSAFYLTPSEKALMSTRRARQLGHTASAQELHKADVVLGLADWKIWAFCAAQFGADTMLYGYSTFLPTIIASIGHWSTAQVQALTIPCYCLGAVSYLAVARLSDAQQRRGLYCVVFGGVSVVGYGILLADARAGVHYFGCFVVALGLYVVVGLPLAWLPSNQPRYGKRTTATGVQLMVGNCSGIMAPFLYKTSERPRYIKGHAVTLAMVGFASGVYGFMWWYLARENKRRKEGREDGKVAGMTEEEIAELGDRNPRYMFTI